MWAGAYCDDYVRLGDSVDSTLRGGHGKIPCIACLDIVGNRYSSPSSEFPYRPVPSSNHSVHRNVANDNHDIGVEFFIHTRGYWKGI
jgi:hypothetical protein